MKAGVIDPAKVTRAALQNAASIAGLLLTTEAVIADKPEKRPPAPAMPPAEWAAWVEWAAWAAWVAWAAWGAWAASEAALPHTAPVTSLSANLRWDLAQNTRRHRRLRLSGPSTPA